MGNIQEEIKNKSQKFKPKKYRAWEFSESQDKTALSFDNETIQIYQIDPGNIINWEYSDRPELELGDIESLANELQTIGQQQPCIVRPIKNKNNYYELIVGERRWRAAKEAKIKLKVIVQEMSDNEAALAQAAENNSRKNLSDFAKGMSYAKLIDKEILSQKDIVEKLKISKQQVSRLLSFSKIPSQVIEAIGDMSKVSARTAEQIKQLCSKNVKYIEIIQKQAKGIREGKVGANKLLQKIETDNKRENRIIKKVLSDKGDYLFSIKEGTNNNIVFSLTKDTSKLVKNKNIDINLFAEEIKKILIGYIKG
jgi:ParB family transcriptional regulator, chromosome partitioning protein